MVRYIAGLTVALLAGAPVWADELDAEFGKAPVAVKLATAPPQDGQLIKTGELDEESPTQAHRRGWYGWRGGWGRGWGGGFSFSYSRGWGSYGGWYGSRGWYGGRGWGWGGYAYRPAYYYPTYAYAPFSYSYYSYPAYSYYYPAWDYYCW